MEYTSSSVLVDSSACPSSGGSSSGEDERLVDLEWALHEAWDASATWTQYTYWYKKTTRRFGGLLGEAAKERGGSLRTRTFEGMGLACAGPLEAVRAFCAPRPTLYGWSSALASIIDTSLCMKQKRLLLRNN